MKTGGNGRVRPHFFFTILKYIIRDLDDDVVSMYSFRNCYNLPYIPVTSSTPRSSRLVSAPL